MADPKNPPSFKDALVDASQAIAGGVGSADYDPKFAGMLLEVIGKFVQPGGKHEQNGGAPAGGAQPPAGGAPGQPVPDGGGTPPPGVGSAAQPGGGAGVPAGGGAQTPPSAPTGPGGMTQGLTPSPDEMRRVLADVAGT